MMRERGLSVDHTTVWRWVQRYAPEINKRMRPLWTRHDRAGRPGAPLTSHAFAKNLKRYARDAGIVKIHIHQTGHTFARVVSEITGSLVKSQEGLGHKNLAATRAYVQRIAVRRDKHSRRITERLVSRRDG